jgi:hypothetical protein
MRLHLERALEAVRAAGLNPVIFEAYRTPERSDWLDRNIAGPAAPAWSSAHNYGLAADIVFLDERGRVLEGRNRATGSQLYEQLVPFMQAEGFVWYGPNDSGHYEYHPSWAGRAGGQFLQGERNRAMEGEDPASLDWLRNMWNRAGAPCLE